MLATSLWAAAQAGNGQQWDSAAKAQGSAEEVAYRLEYRSESSADLSSLLETVGREEVRGGASSLVQHIAASLQGELLCALVENRAGGEVVLAYRLRNPAVHLTVNDRDSPDQARVIEHGLSRRMFPVVDRRGRVLSVRFDASVESQTRDFARALIGILQFVRPEENRNTRRVWEATEEDPSGRYVARYEPFASVSDGKSSRSAGLTEAPESCTMIRKKKLRYSPLREHSAGGAAWPARRTEPRTELDACFDPVNGRVASLRGREVLTTILGGRRVARSESSIAITLDRMRALSESEVGELRREEGLASPGISLSAMAPEAEIMTLVHRQAMGSETLKSLSAKLEQNDRLGKKEDVGLFLAFRALVSLQPATCEPLGRRLANSAARTLTFRTLQDAFAAVGSPEAQLALVRAIEARPGEWAALAGLIPALGLVRDPIPEAEATIRSLAFRLPDSEIGYTAQLALGNMARSLRISSPSRANGIVESILSQADSEVFRRDPGQLLLVLGNTGSQRALPFILPLTRSVDSEMRVRSVLALRFIEQVEAERVLLRALSADNDISVRLAAARALSFRSMTPNALTVQKRCLLREKDKEVRLALLSNLGQFPAKNADTLAFISRLARIDPEAEVREAAARLVASRTQD